MENDYGYSYFQDIFIINLFTQFLVSFSRKGWYIYLLIPLYFGYLISGFLWSYISSPKADDGEEDISKLSKAEQRKLEKKRMKEEKPKVKYIK